VVAPFENRGDDVRGRTAAHRPAGIVAWRRSLTQAGPHHEGAICGSCGGQTRLCLKTVLGRLLGLFERRDAHFIARESPMPMLSFRDRLLERPLLGVNSMYASAGILERIGPHWDWCWIDGQHGEWSGHDVVSAVRACDLVGIFSIVRVPGHDAGTIGRMLDTACHGVMVPMVESATDAERIVAASRFAPLGRRSYGGRRPIDRYGRDYAHEDRPQPLVVCQIETPGGLERADEIAAVAGVDALFFGPDDVALARGMRMDQPRAPDVFAAEMQAVAAAARRHGKIAGGSFPVPEVLHRAVELGFRLVAGGGEAALLAAASQAAAAAARAAASGAAASGTGSTY
jgi:4-hydroxy-2-oxoheptanedioate aldolase